MADYSNQSGYTACQTDEYGNPIKQTGTKGDYGTTTGAHGTTPGAGGVYGGEQQQQQKKGVMEKIKEKLPGGKTDDYGNPIQQTGSKGDYGTNTGTTGTHGTHTGTTGTTGAYGTHTGGEPYQQHEKKGVMEKVKEKLPGGQTDEYGNPIKKTGTMGDYLNTTGPTGAHGTHTGTTGTTGGYGGEQQHEKKGLMEKVKEKLPGGQTDEYGNPIKQTGTKGDYLNTTGTTGAHGTHTGTTGTTGGYGGGQQHEKKGLMEKVKEKLPGGQTDEYGNPIKQTGTKGDYGTTTGTTGAHGTHTGTTGTTGGYGEQQQQQQKKGMMEKIKEKLPGQHN